MGLKSIKSIGTIHRRSTTATSSTGGPSSSRASADSCARPLSSSAPCRSTAASSSSILHDFGTVFTLSIWPLSWHVRSSRWSLTSAAAASHSISCDQSCLRARAPAHVATACTTARIIHSMGALRPYRRGATYSASSSSAHYLPCFGRRRIGWHRTRRQAPEWRGLHQRVARHGRTRYGDRDL